MQNLVKSFNENISKSSMEVAERLLDIQSELGELSKEYLKATNYGTTQFETTADFFLEFGDVLYSLLCLANETKIDAKNALDAVLEKYKNRFETHRNFGSQNE